MCIDNKLPPDAEIYSAIGLNIEMASLPPLHSLSSKQVSYLAIRFAGHLTRNKSYPLNIFSNKAELQTNFYDLIVSARTGAAVIAKSESRKYWRRRLHYESDIARLNLEATRKAVGGASADAEHYASDTTLRKAREKRSGIQEYLKSKIMVNTRSGQSILLSELANQAATNRFNELYWVSKNFEAIASERGMGWLFLTYTAPPNYHPNPVKGKCSYDSSLGVKGSHSYILAAWARVRALLNKWGLKSGIDRYFGFRTAETHKDGSVHWHLLVFAAPGVTQLVIDASMEHFPHYGQMKVEIGDSNIGSASSYIFKYLAKGFDSSIVQRNTSAKDTEIDELRELADLASIRNGERVRAALQAMRVRQCQTFGVQNILTLIRSINKIGEEEFMSLQGEVAAIVKTHIWRNPQGLKYLLEHPELSTKQEGIAPVMLVKKEAKTGFGEKTYQVTGLKIGENIIQTQGRFKIKKI
ncbi:replication endonuclease [Pseudomonas viridiflava]|uniref:replication endonuclease n=1 Tax=Pseudomonas viridiflava TaxID=33069 RepID=UPI001C315FFE|nr:replication endonuclease [Pseudomonas viridiflava]QXG31678.1 replication endonuclease [Pseudomonas viridiflava]